MIPATMCPVPGAFAFASTLGAIDAAFGSTLSQSDDCLIDAALKAALAYGVTVTADLGDITVPKGYKSATTGPWADKWIAAINAELKGLLANCTWVYVPLDTLPHGVNIMRCHFVFTVKRNPD